MKEKGPVEWPALEDSVDADRRAERRRRARSAPLAVEQRVERLVEIPSVAEKRPAENTFLHRAQFLERAIAAAILDGGARFEPMHAERLEHELQDELRAFVEHTGSPERGAERKSPLSVFEILPKVAYLEDADRGVETVERDREACVRTGRALAMRPCDEHLEDVDRGRRL